MKDTHTIVISGIIFHVEPEGYRLLQSYLKALQRGLSPYYSEFESEVAEFLLQQLNNGPIHTTLHDVEYLIKTKDPASWPQKKETMKDLEMKQMCNEFT